MKKMGPLLNLSIITAVLSLANSLQAQTNVVNSSLSGGLELRFTDFAPSGYPNSYGGLQVAGDGVGFASISDTVSYDPVAETVRQQGTISLTAPIPSAVFSELETINGKSVTGVLTINQSFANGSANSFNFDTGAQAVVPISPGSSTLVLNKYGPNPGYAGAGSADISRIPINATYSLVTGGQTYTGSFSYTLIADNVFGMPLFSTFTPSGGALAVNGFGNTGIGTTSSYIGNESLVLAEPNGFSITVSSGNTDPYDFATILLSSAPVQVSQAPASSVPDQFATLPLFALGALGLFGFRRKLGFNEVVSKV